MTEAVVVGQLLEAGGGGDTDMEGKETEGQISGVGQDKRKGEE